LCQYNTIVPFCQQKFSGNGTWEALNDKEIYLKSDRGTQLANPGMNSWRCWFKSAAPTTHLTGPAQISDQQREEKDGKIARIQVMGVERMREVANEKD